MEEKVREGNEGRRWRARYRGDTDDCFRGIAESETIWDLFSLWKVESLSGNEVMATLVSPRQWLLKKAEAISVCEDREDGDIGLENFTTDEAKEFRDQYDDTIVALSDMLSENGLDRFNKYDCRYLCNDFNSTFCFYNTQIVKSGETRRLCLASGEKVRVKKQNKRWKIRHRNLMGVLFNSGILIVLNQMLCFQFLWLHFPAPDTILLPVNLRINGSFRNL